jgi:hypothetical protein
MPLAVAILTLGAGVAHAQSASPAPLSGLSEQCTNELAPLREDAEKRGRLVRTASNLHASPVEGCKLIADFSEAEMKMIEYVEAHAATCGIPAQISDQLKIGHQNTEALQKKICTVAQRMQQRGPAGPTGDFDPPTSFR